MVSVSEVVLAEVSDVPGGDIPLHLHQDGEEGRTRLHLSEITLNKTVILQTFDVSQSILAQDQFFFH